MYGIINHIKKENNMQAIVNLAIIGMPILIMFIAMIIKGEW